MDFAIGKGWHPTSKQQLWHIVSLGFHFLIGHFTVMDGSGADGDLVLIQTFPLYYVNQVILTLTSIFQGQFP